MKPFACFAVILLARFALSENLPSCAPPPQIKYCELDDYLQALKNQTTSGPQFCGKYLEDDSISLPNYVPAAASASSISSACSCLIQAQTTPKPTASTNSSYILGSAGSSISTTEVSSHGVSAATALSSAILFASPSLTPIVPQSVNEYTTSTIYTLSTITYTESGKTFTVTDTVVDYVTASPVTNSSSSTQIIAALSTSSSMSSTKGHSRTRCPNGPQATQRYPFGNETSSYKPTASGGVFLSSPSGIAYPSSVKYPMSNSTLSQNPLGTGYPASLTAYIMATSIRSNSPARTGYPLNNSTASEFPRGTGYPIPRNSTALHVPSGTGYSISANCTTSYIPSGTGYPIPRNSTAPSIFPTSTPSLKIIGRVSKLPETIGISITRASSAISSSYLPSVTAFCSTDAAALLYSEAGSSATSYCSSLLSIQPRFVHGGYKFITQTTYTTRTRTRTRTTTIAPTSVTVLKRSTELDLYPLTSTYDLDQQSSACSCLSIQLAEISVTTTIPVHTRSTIVTSTKSHTPAPTQAVVDEDPSVRL
ncbi:hypothetical protein DSL72_008043 [Monilinia vaccinii-corymbosi]|uniref:Uncharacterized protein n=1 Tax=Monilinia vaccinii-corymbosi TaxID=61207 RepID=A0A8A3PJU2_9HELO|nr:hypothetical protein DSL72_008043 [Monilinia vaccinii-corymbosi]